MKNELRIQLHPIFPPEEGFMAQVHDQQKGTIEQWPCKDVEELQEMVDEEYHGAKLLAEKSSNQIIFIYQLP